MAFFKFRKGGDDSAAAPSQPESVEVLRRRARHRLIGAAVLVLLGVIGFPLLFDTQPRPVAVDIPIEIPDRNKAKPLPAVQPSAKAPVASEPAAAVARPASAAASRPIAAGAVNAVPEPAKPEPRTEAVAVAPKAAAAASKPAAAASKPVAASSRPAVATAPAPDDAARAKALLDGQAAPPKLASTNEPAASEGRFVVQVGAFEDAAKAREVQRKLERAGLKAYSHVAETQEGKRTRVRAGPFPTRAEADKAAARIKELDLQTRILTL